MAIINRTSIWWISVSAFLAGLVAGGGVLIAQKPAHGALAIGLPENVAREGVAFGWAVNYPNEDEAKEKAMELCRRSTKAEPAARVCRVVKAFSDECLAIAWDLVSGTRGFGWAVRSTLEAAKKDAMAECVRTATRTREKHCEIVGSDCDGSWWARGPSGAR